MFSSDPKACPDLRRKWARAAGARDCPPRRGGPTPAGQIFWFHVFGCPSRA